MSNQTDFEHALEMTVTMPAHWSAPRKISAACDIVSRELIGDPHEGDKWRDMESARLAYLSTLQAPAAAADVEGMQADERDRQDEIGFARNGF